MEGQPKHPLIHLSPYFNPASASRGYHGRRLTRHGFLNNLWGLQEYRKPTPPSNFMDHLRKMPRAKPDAQPTPQHGLGVPDGVPAHLIQATLDRNLGAFHREFQDVGRGIQRLEKTAEEISNEIVQGLDKFFKRLAPPESGKQQGEEVERAKNVNLQREHQLEIEDLQKKRELDKKRLEEMEKDLEAASVREQVVAADLARVQSMMDGKLKQLEEQENTQKDITAAFLSLRETILAFAGSTAIQLGPLPNTLVARDNLFRPRSWNHSSRSQRKYRVMAKIFQLLFQRILRPGLRIFGVQVFLENDGNSPISDAEVHLRSLEEELEAIGVDDTKLSNWIATTIDTTSLLQNIPGNIEGTAQEIFEALLPVIRFAFVRNTDKVRDQLSVICEEAVHLKLALRQAPGNYKIEVPSLDSKKWGEPGCDDETRSLNTTRWLRILDREEVRTSTQNRREGSISEHTKSDIACIPFGALTKLEEGPDGERIKTVVEKGWVTTCTKAGSHKLKRGASALTVGEEERHPQKRATPNHGINPRYLARVKALVGGE
ncbi:hypothetical protein F5144DRAFT_490618 [Chaetomium tenue]|uniref:Uncharacterized protein n=1 Tax=Chaetomium tenue TaxID=1854479 RepID=A0ACB7P7F5_9PEZI|nr:hypothetical protein F5144DRAFT_490618 [Chaetomium globosum]